MDDMTVDARIAYLREWLARGAHGVPDGYAVGAVLDEVARLRDALAEEKERFERYAAWVANEHGVGG
jgi:hypothetical protein